MPPEQVIEVPSALSDRPVDELVLPVVPGSVHNRATNLVVNLAQRWGLPVRVVHVLDPTRSHDLDPDATVAGMLAWYPQLSVEVEQLAGDDPAAAIAPALRPTSLPVLATEHADAWAFKDSVAEALVTASDLPMLLVGPNVKRADLDGEVIVGYDESPAAESALRLAVGLAAALGHRLWLVRVVPEPHRGDDLHNDLTTKLQRLAEEFDVVASARWEVIQSNSPVEAITAFAHRRGAGLIVAGTRGRSDPSRRSMSSIAMGLVAAAEQPVLVVKPTAT